MALTGLFGVILIGLSSPLTATCRGRKYGLISVENHTGWPIGKAAKDAFSENDIQFMTENLIFKFGPPKIVISNNTTCFTAKKLRNFMEDN